MGGVYPPAAFWVGVIGSQFSETLSASKCYPSHLTIIINGYKFLIGNYFLSIQGETSAVVWILMLLLKSNIILIHDPGYKWPVFYSGSFRVFCLVIRSEILWWLVLRWVFFIHRNKLNIWEVFLIISSQNAAWVLKIPSEVQKANIFYKITTVSDFLSSFSCEEYSGLSRGCMTCDITDGKQIWESNCLPVSQTVKRFLKMYNNSNMQMLMGRVVSFSRNLWLYYYYWTHWYFN